ncbi:MAG TPA: ABC transporter permease [Spirochaetia bacterium]|nr:ABC transporter permease [Spirochaetia bacterium]
MSADHEPGIGIDVTATSAAHPRRMRLKLPLLVWPYVAVVLLVGLGAIISPGFESPNHLLLILNLASFLGLVAAGQSLVILSGGIDLSVSSVVTLAGVVSATMMNGSDSNVFIAVVASLALGLAVGMVNGFGVAYMGIHPLVVSLGMASIVQGAALLYTDGAPKGSAAPVLTEIATNRLFGVVPYVLLIWAVVAAVVILFTYRSVWGRRLYALGNSPKAAYYSGVRVPWVLMSIYMATSVLAALAGVLLTGYTRTSYLTIGNPYQLNSIAAVVIGGSSILGGEGSYVGTIAGCIIMVLVQSLLPILSIPEAGRRIISGALILLLLLLYGRGKKLRK